MDVTSLYSIIPQEEGINIVCDAYEAFHRNEPPIPTTTAKSAQTYPNRELLPI